jgi:hypothetical protein
VRLQRASTWRPDPVKAQVEDRGPAHEPSQRSTLQLDHVPAGLDHPDGPVVSGLGRVRHADRTQVVGGTEVAHHVLEAR